MLEGIVRSAKVVLGWADSGSGRSMPLDALSAALPAVVATGQPVPELPVGDGPAPTSTNTEPGLEPPLGPEPESMLGPAQDPGPARPPDPPFDGVDEIR